MKILQIHNYYDRNSPSGENIVVDMERELLREAGHEVSGLYVYNDEFNNLKINEKIRYAGNWLGVGSNTLCIDQILTNFNPDVVHVHNTFPLLGANTLNAIKNVPTVLTLHNYRLSCINGLKLRNGAICNRCDPSEMNIIAPTLHRCYRGSVVHSLFASYGLSRLRRQKTFHKLNHFIALTDFQKKYLTELGIPSSSITVKPNAYNGKYINSYNKNSKTVLFVGRLSREKGVLNLISTWRKLQLKNWKLKIIGSGPLLDEVRGYDSDPSIEVLGMLSHETVMSEISKAGLIVVPSLWYEGYPMVIREAIARGIPSLVSNIGSTASAVSSDIARTFNPKDPVDFAQKLKLMIEDKKLRDTLSTNTYDFFEEFLELEKNTEKLLAIYDRIVNA